MPKGILFISKHAAGGGLFPLGAPHQIYAPEGLGTIGKGDRSMSCGNESACLSSTEGERCGRLTGTWGPQSAADPARGSRVLILRSVKILREEVALNLLYEEQSRTQTGWSLT